MKKLIFTISAMLISCFSFAQEIPQKISYQGKLLENNQPVTGTKSIIFTIGTWSETKNVSITDGLYSVTLGETTPIPISIFNNTSTITLQINVAGNNLTPQTDILSVPYAYKSEKSVDAEQIASRPVSTTAPTTNQVLKWNGISWAPASDADNDNQTLSVSGSNLTISGGNTVTINSGVSGSGTTNYLPKFTGSTTLGNSVIYENAQNVAIGSTTTSNAKLNVYALNDVCIDVQSAGDNGINVESYSGVPGESAIYAKNTSGGKAGYFLGDVTIQGNLNVTGSVSKGGGSFKIDHPLDPENKYLYHSFVESSDMMNVYNGNVLMDNNGEAVIELPDWFEALNKDFRYQLTCIGSYASVYVAEEISNNTFKIAGGTPRLKISWQVTGIRQDPWTEQNRIQVEVEKIGEEKGHYLHYKEYNQPIEKSIEAVKNPKILKENRRAEK